MWRVPMTEPLSGQVCVLCGARSRLIAAHLGVCLDCIRGRPVGCIACFIAALNPAIPYALLGFAPHFLFPDLPRTSVRHAEEAQATVHAAGLHTVRIGNRHLLSHDY